MRTKIILHAMFATAIALTLGCNRSEPAKEQSDWDALRAEVSSLRKCLAQDGAYAFVTNAATPKLAPHIHSQCWVDWLPKEDVKRREYEQEKRDLGLDILGCLEKYAWGIEAHEDLEGNKKSAMELLAIAEWLNTTPGYGNYLLKRWAENLALIRICHLAVDGRVGLDEIKSYFSRVGTPIQDLQLRVRILNEESPHKYSLPSSNLTEEAGSDNICRQWAQHLRESMQHYSKWCESNSRDFPSLKFEDVIWDDRTYSFYIEDYLDGNHTLRDAWGKKAHYTSLCTGMMSMLHWSYLDTIIGYWEVVGELPLPNKEIAMRPGSFKGLCKEGDEYKNVIEAKWKATSKLRPPRGIDSRVIALIKDGIEDRITENCRRRGRP